MHRTLHQCHSCTAPNVLCGCLLPQEWQGETQLQGYALVASLPKLASPRMLGSLTSSSLIPFCGLALAPRVSQWKHSRRHSHLAVSLIEIDKSNVPIAVPVLPSHRQKLNDSQCLKRGSTCTLSLQGRTQIPCQEMPGEGAKSLVNHPRKNQHGSILRRTIERIYHFRPLPAIFTCQKPVRFGKCAHASSTFLYSIAMI